MSNDLYIFSGGRGNTQRIGHRTFIVKEEAEDFAKMVNGKVTLDHLPFEHKLHMVWRVWYEYEEEEKHEHGYIRDNY